MFYKTIKIDVTIPIDELATKPDTRTRRADHNYQHIHANKINYASSFIVNTIPEWNNLQKGIKSASSVSAFKSRLSNLKKMNKYIYLSYFAHGSPRSVIAKGSCYVCEEEEVQDQPVSAE